MRYKISLDSEEDVPVLFFTLYNNHSLTLKATSDRYKAVLPFKFSCSRSKILESILYIIPSIKTRLPTLIAPTTPRLPPLHHTPHNAASPLLKDLCIVIYFTAQHSVGHTFRDAYALKSGEIKKF